MYTINCSHLLSPSLLGFILPELLLWRHSTGLCPSSLKVKDIETCRSTCIVTGNGRRMCLCHLSCTEGNGIGIRKYLNEYPDMPRKRFIVHGPVIVRLFWLDHKAAKVIHTSLSLTCTFSLSRRVFQTVAYPVEMASRTSAVSLTHEEDADPHTVTTFISKVWKIVEKPEYNHLILWSTVSSG